MIDHSQKYFIVCCWHWKNIFEICENLSEEEFYDQTLIKKMKSITSVAKNKMESKTFKISNVGLVRNEV